MKARLGVDVGLLLVVAADGDDKAWHVGSIIPATIFSCISTSQSSVFSVLDRSLNLKARHGDLDSWSCTNSGGVGDIGKYD